MRPLGALREIVCEVKALVVVYVLLAIVLFSLLVLAHEFGHFITAKLSGVQVNEFSLFMGPAIWKKQKGETLYALRCIPFGGYCAMEGEDGENNNPRAFVNTKVWKRLMILVAGAVMNFIVGFLILAIFLGIYTSVYRDGYMANKQVVDVLPDRTFAGQLLVGDEFYEINGRRVFVQSDITMLLDREADGIHDIVVIRDGEKVLLEQITMQKSPEDGKYGFSIGSDTMNFGILLKESWNLSLDAGRLTWMGLSDLITGRESVKNVAGPVGAVDMVVSTVNQTDDTGFAILNIIYFFGFISINLGVMNLLPIPALDGGRSVCLLVTAAAEKIFRRKINPKYETYLHAGFMILLLAFMAIVTFKDVWGLFT